MEALALYLIKSTVWLTGFAMVYLLFLRNERFFLLNRIYLVLGIIVSIVFPLFTWHYTVMIANTPTVEVSGLQMIGTVDIPEPFPTQAILLYIYLAGALYLLFRVIRQTITVLRVIRKSEILRLSSAKLIRTTEYPASFSFFSFVFVNPSTCDTETNEIVNHEMEHIRQQHWIDLLLFQALLTLQWFNPVSWLYGHFIRQNHEYLADERALQRSSNPGIYRAALLNQMFGGPVISLANSFNYSLNKKRFNMMKQTINSPIRKFKLLLVLPLIAGVFYAFAAPEYKYMQAKENSAPIEDANSGNEKVTINARDTLKGSNMTLNGNFIAHDPQDTSMSIPGFKFHSKKIYGTYKNDITTIKADTISIDLATTTSLVFIDGKESSKAEVDKLNPSMIESVSILKGNSAISKYGDKAKNEVVEITMKKVAYSVKNEFIDVKGKDIGNVQKVNTQKENQPYTVVEQMPTFPGGEEALKTFIVTNVKYPAIAREKGIQGKVFIKFVVTNTGSITNAKVVRGVDPSLDQEAIRVVESMPNWKPGMQNGENVVVSYTIPIEFKLQQSKISTKKLKGADNQSDQPYTVVEQMPTFIGGEEALRKFMVTNVKYPVQATQKGIQGKVFINFVVTKTGIVTNAKVLRGVDPSLDKEAMRVIESMPNWNPGKQNGDNVRVSYTIPIEFKLQQSKISTEKLKGANNQSDQPYTVVEQMPTFIGGEEALRKFMVTNVKYPVLATQKGIQGKVFINFVVTKTGSVTNAKVLRGIDPSLDQEAIRVIESMPIWIPGKQDGENVDVQYTIPINFVLQPSEISTEKLKGADQPYASVESTPSLPGGFEALKAFSDANIQYPGFVEQMPSFPGGFEALKAYVASTLKYPVIDLESGTQGKVFVKFIIDKTGAIINAKISRGVETHLDNEALRIVNSMPTWIPGKQNGENVSVAYEMPINFKLPDDWNMNLNLRKEKLAISHRTVIKPEDQAAQKHELIIVPNPTSDKATITLKDSDSKSKLEISVYDSYGKLILKESKNGPTFTLSVAKLTTGTYLVVANDGIIQFQGHLVVNH